METVTCCQRNGYGECGCREGKLCPEGRYELPSILTRRLTPDDITRRQQESGYLWTRDIGVEAADAPRVTGAVPPIVTTELRPARAVDWQAVVIWGAVAIAITALAWLSIADPRDLSTLWPRLVALASF